MGRHSGLAHYHPEISLMMVLMTVKDRADDSTNPYRATNPPTMPQQQGLNNKASPELKTTQCLGFLGSNPGSKEAGNQPLSPPAAQEQSEATQKQNGCARLRNRCHTPLLDLNCWDRVANSELKYLSYDKVCGKIADRTIDSAPGVE